MWTLGRITIMQQRFGKRFFAIAVVVLVVDGLPSFAANRPSIDYNRDIRPILSENCFACHGPDANKRKAGLRLDVRDGAIKPLKSGETAVVPGDTGHSAMLARILSDDADEHMPPEETGKKVTAAQAEVLRRWVQEGAVWKGLWSLEAPKKPELPEVKNSTWSKNAIDRFVLERLEKEGLNPSPEADRPTLLRRLSLDLTGLPPTTAEVDAFTQDASPNAYEKAVDHFLASPHYGERMALEWLDAARFADTHGYHIDSGRDMTRWRDWVIHAFNTNTPFDVFTVEQLAGDLLPNPTLEQKIASGFHRNNMVNFEGGAVPEEYLTAYNVDRVNTTGAVWLGLTVGCTQCHDHKYDPISQKDFYQLYAFFNGVAEKGLDGARGNAAPVMSVGTPAQNQEIAKLTSAIDAIEKKLVVANASWDAAQLTWEKEETTRPDAGSVGVVAGPREIKSSGGAKLDVPSNVASLLRLPNEARSDKNKAEIRTWFRANLMPEYKSLRDQANKLKKQLVEANANLPSTMVMQDLAKPRDTFILMRGQYDKPGEKVTPNTPACLPPMPTDAPKNRLGLARWLVDPGHPLTARVIVNRYWQMYFGTGLVKTAEDFGTQGEYPTHPELLDWLATEFIASHWDVKGMQKRIVMSATYRQASHATPELIVKDPEDRLLARAPRFRLQAEFVRDQALAVSGLLNREIGGKSVSPYQPPGLWEELMSRSDGANFTAQSYVQSHGPDLYRRGMYTFWKRTSPPASLTTFDAPDREVCTVRRGRTNTPLQALALMNDPTYVEAARKLAERAMTEGGATAEERIAYVYRIVLARSPRPQELAVLRNVFDQEWSGYRRNAEGALKLICVGESARNEKLDASEHAAWTMVCSAILNLDETVTKN